MYLNFHFFNWIGVTLAILERSKIREDNNRNLANSGHSLCYSLGNIIMDLDIHNFMYIHCGLFIASRSIVSA